jgi:hypothetical protein
MAESCENNSVTRTSLHYICGAGVGTWDFPVIHSRAEFLGTRLLDQKKEWQNLRFFFFYVAVSVLLLFMNMHADQVIVFLY